LVVRDRVREGTRAYVAFHSPRFVRQLFRGFQILDHDTADRITNFAQDTWVIAKVTMTPATIRIETTYFSATLQQWQLHILA